MVAEPEAVFPEDDVRAAIQECWDMATAEAKPPAPTADKPGSIMDRTVEIDSHGVARCFVSIQDKTGIDIPETEAKDTGYDSLDDLLVNLIPLAKKYFEKQKDKIAKQKCDDADSSA
jgi:hypothetical protein